MYLNEQRCEYRINTISTGFVLFGWN